MPLTKIKNVVIISSVFVAFIYIGLWIVPLRIIYDLKNIEKIIYEPGTVNIVEIRKKFALLPGPNALWAVKTQKGYDVYRKFPGFKEKRRDRALSFPIDNFIEGFLTKNDVSFGKSGFFENLIVSEKLLVQFENFDLKNWAFGGFVVSPDKRNLLYSQNVDGKVCVVTDGIQGNLYKAIIGASIEFSPDSNRVAYVVRNINKWFYVVDDLEQKEYDKVLKNFSVFSPDSKRIAYGAKTGNKWFAVVDGNEEGPYDNMTTPVFSPDSRRVAYSVYDGNQAFMVVDGKKGKRYDLVSNPIFSPNSQRIAYFAKKNDKYLVIIDGMDNGMEYTHILHPPVFSPNSKRIAYVVVKDNKFYPIINGIEGKKYDYESTKSFAGHSGIDSILFSPDSKRFAYMVEDGEHAFMVVDGVEGKKYDYIFNLPVFSPDSRSLAYHARLGKNFFVIIDGVEGEKYENNIHGFPSKNVIIPQGMRWNIFSPDSKKVAFAVVGKKKVHIILNGKKIGHHEKVPGAVVYSPDSRRVAYIARDGDREYVVVVGVGKIDYEMVGLAGSGITFDSNDNFQFVALKYNGVYVVDVKLEGSLAKMNIR